MLLSLHLHACRRYGPCLDLSLGDRTMRLSQPDLRGLAAPAAAATLHSLLPPSAANAVAELADAAGSAAPITFEPRGITPEDTGMPAGLDLVPCPPSLPASLAHPVVGHHRAPQ